MSDIRVVLSSVKCPEADIEVVSTEDLRANGCIAIAQGDDTIVMDMAQAVAFAQGVLEGRDRAHAAMGAIGGLLN